MDENIANIITKLSLDDPIDSDRHEQAKIKEVYITNIPLDYSSLI